MTVWRPQGLILESADSFQGNVPKGHCLERTSPKGMRFIGTCRMCGRAGLTADQAREECPGRPGFTPAAPATEGAWQYSVPLAAADQATDDANLQRLADAAEEQS